MNARLKKILKRILFRQDRVVPVYVPVLASDLLKGRKALITGGTSGIGNEIARAFLRSGADVVITGRDSKRVNDAVEQIKRELGECRIYGLELNNLMCEEFDAKIASASQLMGGLDILVNNAGIVKGASFGRAVPDEYDLVMESNLKGAFFLSQSIAKSWRGAKVRGNILNICSSSSMRPGNSSYILSKWGLRSLTLGLAKVLIKEGIVVNGLAPGPTSTPQFVPDKSRGISWPFNPSGRLVTMQEIGNLAVVLVSDLGRMIVGDIVYASGGAGVITVDDVEV